MNRLRRSFALLSLGLLTGPPAPANSAPGGVLDSGVPTNVHGWRTDPPLDVALYDRTEGRMLPVWYQHGRYYVAGEPGHEYEIRLRSARDARVLAVTSVDGINVVTGETAAIGQAGYVLEPGADAAIDGWRKSLGEVASFVFTAPRRSYAARTGRPDEVGVIGIAMFREAQPARLADAFAQPRWRDEAENSAPAEVRDSTSARRETAGAGTNEDRAATRAAESKSAAGLDRARAAPAAPPPALGTGHGARRDSRVTRTEFERASATPDAVVRIYYDSRRNLVARGVVPPDPPVARRRPDPFPAGGFVPDP